MKLRLISVILALSILLSACQSSGGKAGQPNQPGAQPQSAGKSNPYSSVFTPPADPAAAVVALDETTAAEAVIPVEGGTIQATGADGTQYTLTIPGDALVSETKIRLVPAAVSGLPFGGEQTYAAQLQPEGLAFNNYVTLTIVPAQEIPVKEQLFFGYLGEGSDVIFAPPVKDTAEIKIQLLHFSGYGVTKGLLADPESVRERLGGSAERRLQSLAAELLGRERQAQLLGSEDTVSSDLYEQLQPLFERYKTEVVDVRIAAAGDSCAAGQLALQTVLGFERQKQLLGAESSGGLIQYAGLMATVGKVCLKEEYNLCAQDHIIHRMVPVWLGFERQYQMLGMTEDSSYAEISKLARELTQKCLTFDLEFESDAHFDGGYGGGYDSTVKSKVPLKFNPDELKISGSSALINTAFTFKVPRCTVTSNRGGSTLPIGSLTYIPDTHSPDDTLGYVRDFSLRYFPASTTESFTVACKDTPPYTSPPNGLWFGVYLVLHQDELSIGDSSGEGAPPPAPPEMDIAAMMAAAESGVMLPSFSMTAPAGAGDDGFLLEGWEVKGGELFATKEWIKSDGSLGISERGTFKLYHRPQK